LEKSARDGDVADGHEITERKVHADTEHQQDDPDLCELRRELCVGHEAGRKWSNHDAGQKIADEGGQPYSLGNVAPNQGVD
jgi:hypothetical protein